MKNLHVDFLSLVKAPATGKSLTLKSKDAPDAQANMFAITKTDDERMVAYGVVYAPGQEDAHGDSADAATIRRAAYEFMRDARLKNIDTEHSFNQEMAFVAESWLVRKGDELFPDEPEGAWAVGIQIGDPDLWAMLKSGELTGISLAGVAHMAPDPDDPPRRRYIENAAPQWCKSWLKTFNKTPPKPTPQETEMKKEDVEGIVQDTLKSVLPDLLKEALKSADTDDTDPPAKADKPETSHDVDELDARIDAAVAKAVGNQLEDIVTKAVAKGVTETDTPTPVQKDSFL